jgi:hypothetical protein
VFLKSFFENYRLVKDAFFPLILTFSLREKVQPLIVGIKFTSVGAVFRLNFSEKLGAFLPLPMGEGRGEGGTWRPN